MAKQAKEPGSPENWKGWLKAIYIDLCELEFAHRLFWKTDELQRTHPTPVLEGPLGVWMGKAYFYWLAAGVRRQLDADPKCISLTRLLRCMKSNSDVLAGGGMGGVSTKQIGQDLKDLEAKGKPIIRYAHHRVAHFDENEYLQKGTKGPGPSAAQVGEWLRTAKELADKYALAIRGDVATECLPSIDEAVAALSKNWRQLTARQGERDE